MPRQAQPGGCVAIATSSGVRCFERGVIGSFIHANGRVRVAARGYISILFFNEGVRAVCRAWCHPPRETWPVLRRGRRNGSSKKSRFVEYLVGDSHGSLRARDEFERCGEHASCVREGHNCR